MSAVIVVRIGSIELPHELGHVGFKSFDDQMIMVAHQYVGVRSDVKIPNALRSN